MRCIFLFCLVFGYAGAAFGNWHVETVDDCGSCGITSAIALDSWGNPRIVYPREGYGAKYAECTGTSWEIQYIHQPSYGSAGWFSMEVDDDDLAHVSFGGSCVEGAAYAVQGETSGWELSFLPLFARWTSLDLDSQGSPCIALLDSQDDNRFLYTGTQGWENELISSGADSYGSISLELDDQDRAHVAWNSGQSSLNVIYSMRDQYGVWSTHTVDSSMTVEPRGISLALDLNGNPAVSYNVDGEVRLARFNGGSWMVETVYSMDTGAWEFSTALAVDSWNCPHIVHCSSTGDSLLYSVNHGNGWETETICSNGTEADLVLDASDTPHVSFYSAGGCMYAVRDSEGVSSSGAEADPFRLNLDRNPFAGRLGISFCTGEDCDITVTIYDITGREVDTVASGFHDAGVHSVHWVPDQSLPAGEYTVVLRSACSVECERVVRLN